MSTEYAKMYRIIRKQKICRLYPVIRRDYNGVMENAAGCADRKCIRKNRGQRRMHREDFNEGWIFYPAGRPDEWKKVRLPHDAMQTEQRMPELESGALTAFYPGGDYWYEKRVGPGKEADVRYLEFGGVFMDSTVYLNEEPVGGHLYGYSGFYVDLSGKWRRDEENTIRVFVHNSCTPNSRWYSGAGIYRPVYMLTGEKEHILPDGIRIVTKSLQPTVIEVQVEHTGTERCQVQTEILWKGKVVAEGKGNCCCLELPDARLWNHEHPNLYSCIVNLVKDQRICDRSEVEFGVRTLDWNAREGLLINGESQKLVGACMHHDRGILGAFENKAAALYRVSRLKKAGFNAIRGAHNPQSKELLEACDELGMYVVEEFFDGWFTSGMNGYPRHFQKEWRKDLELSVRKCCSHPSVIAYSIGNEVAETAGEKGLALAREITELTRRLDGTRPVTMGVNLMMNTMQKKFGFQLGGGEEKENEREDTEDQPISGRMDGSVMFNFMVSLFAARPFIEAMSAPKRSDPGSREIFGMLDIAGYNYGDMAYEGHHRMHPERVLMGTETKAIAGVKKRIDMVKKYPWIIGDFVWTGWDYLGECGLGIIDYNRNLGSFTKPYPAETAGCGMLDLNGNRETMYYDLALAWGLYDKPYIAVSHPKHAKDRMISSMYRTTDGIDSWTFPGYEGVKTRVRVASPGDYVILAVNGHICGKKRLKDQIAVFRVPYQPGKISVRSYERNGKEIGRSSLKTCGREKRISICPSCSWLSASEDDLIYLNIILTDERGQYWPEERKLYVSVEGAAVLCGIGSGNVRTTERYTGDFFTTYNGKLTAVIRSVGRNGDVRVRVCGRGLEERIVRLKALNRPVLEKYINQGGTMK